MQGPSEAEPVQSLGSHSISDDASAPPLTLKADAKKKTPLNPNTCTPPPPFYAGIQVFSTARHFLLGCSARHALSSRMEAKLYFEANSQMASK